MNNQNELIIYQDKNKKIEVQLKEETIWLDTHKIARVFRETGRADELGSGVRNIFKYTTIYSKGGQP